MINFLAEISKRAMFPVNPTPSNGVRRQYNVYQLDTGPLPEDSYWPAWGGYDDRNFSERIELYYSKFLGPVNSLHDLQSSPYSYYLEDKTVYINIPIHPWIYGGYSQGVEDVYPYLSFALNENDPTELTLIGKTAHTKLAVPSINVKLSENISGVVLSQGFSLTLANEDGLRKWGLPYAEHILEPWQITQKPSLDYSKAQENYFSSCNISYINSNDPHADEKLIYVFDENRNRAELLYRKTEARDFETSLINSEAVKELARLLSGRYTFLKPALKLAVGIDTSGFELLDTVIIKMDVNNRLFTEHEKYVITEINQAQDTLALEAAG